MTDNYPNHQATYLGSWEKNRQGKCLKTSPRHIIFKLQKIKDKETILKEKKLGGGGVLTIKIIIDDFSEIMQRRP